jgi:type IV secretory pathway TrbF-like protein
MQEEVFFDRDGVKVTNARFVVHAQTYAMNGVTSVKSHVTPPNRGGLIVAAIVGVLMVIVLSGAAKILGVAVAAGAIWMLTQQKSLHAVFLSSASGEVQALSNTDEDYINGVVNALNEALIHRG